VISRRRKIVQVGGPMPLLKKVIAKMDTPEITKYKKLSKDYVTSSQKLYKAWQKRHAHYGNQKKLKELTKAAEMLGRRAEKVQDRYDEFYKKMTKKYKM
jgi:nitrogenase molybdenum-iron protein alpha/beta subunit